MTGKPLPEGRARNARIAIPVRPGEKAYLEAQIARHWHGVEVAVALRAVLCDAGLLPNETEEKLWLQKSKST